MTNLLFSHLAFAYEFQSHRQRLDRFSQQQHPIPNKTSDGSPYVLESSTQAVQLHYALVGELEAKNTEKILPSFEQRNLMDFYGRHVSNQE